MRTFRADYKSGIAAETRNLSLLQKFFDDDTICKTKSKYDPIDFIGKHYYEIKSRTVKSTAFPDTIISKSKIDKYNKIKDGKNLYLIFPFTDCIKYIQYTPDLFDTFECKEFVRHQRSDFNDIKQLYYFIPVEKLSELV